MHGWINEKDRSFNSHYQHRAKEKSYYLQKQIMQILYKPKKKLFENPESYDFNEFHISDKSISNLYSKASSEYIFGRDKWRKHLISSNFSMWDSIYRTYKLFTDFSIDNNTNYDLILRMRYDVLPHLNLQHLINRYKKNTILVPANNMPPDMVCDWFALGESDVMMNYFNLFNSLPDLMSTTQIKHGQWCNELGLYEHLLRNKINVDEIEMRMAFH